MNIGVVNGVRLSMHERVKQFLCLLHSVLIMCGKEYIRERMCV